MRRILRATVLALGLGTVALPAAAQAAPVHMGCVTGPVSDGAYRPHVKAMYPTVRPRSCRIVSTTYRNERFYHAKLLRVTHLRWRHWGSHGADGFGRLHGRRIDLSAQYPSSLSYGDRDHRSFEQVDVIGYRHSRVWSSESHDLPFGYDLWPLY